MYFIHVQIQVKFSSTKIKGKLTKGSVMMCIYTHCVFSFFSLTVEHRHIYMAYISESTFSLIYKNSRHIVNSA